MFRSIPEFDTEDTYLIEELDVCGGISRIDIALVNGMLHGFEIKSDRDNLERLPSQKEDYNCVFDTVTVVTTQTHLAKLDSLIPEWWGIISAVKHSDVLELSVVRRPGLNPSVNEFRLAQFLWRDELLDLLRTEAGITTGVKSKTRRALARLVCDNLSSGQIAEYVRTVLKTRQDWKARPLLQLCDD